MIPTLSSKTSLIDVPKEHSSIDQLDIGKYEDALVKLIKGADTPLTIALQGEWGSGKTSLMNTLRHRLADSSEESCFFPVWVNTWEYSIMGEPEDAILRILRSIILQIATFIPEKDKSLFENAMGWLQQDGKAAVFTSWLAVSVAVKSATGTDDITGLNNKSGANAEDNGPPVSEIFKAKIAIQSMLDACLNNGTKKGFLFFIDDLDRINPPVVVQILELLKNIFDLKNCIFVLAIDYQVVIKGLKPKFGDLTSDNERKFRSFFDKTIQLPFSMPVAIRVNLVTQVADYQR